MLCVQIGKGDQEAIVISTTLGTNSALSTNGVAELQYICRYTDIIQTEIAELNGRLLICAQICYGNQFLVIVQGFLSLNCSLKQEKSYFASVSRLLFSQPIAFLYIQQISPISSGYKCENMVISHYSLVNSSSSVTITKFQCYLQMMRGIQLNMHTAHKLFTKKR